MSSRTFIEILQYILLPIKFSVCLIGASGQNRLWRVFPCFTIAHVCFSGTKIMHQYSKHNDIESEPAAVQKIRGVYCINVKSAAIAVVYKIRYFIGANITNKIR